MNNAKKLLKASLIVIVLIIGQNFFPCLADLQAQTFPDVERAITQEEYAKATELINSKLGADPKNDRLFYLRGRVYFLTENFSLAKADFQKGINYSRNNPMNYVGLGSVYVKENNFNEAKVNLDLAGERNKNMETDVMISIADAYLGSKDRKFTDEAEKILYKLRDLDKKNPKVFVALGDLYLAQGIDELALTNYQEATKLEPNFILGHLRIGQLKVKNNDYNEGARAFERAIEIDPKFAPAYKELGELWYKAGKVKVAKEKYKKYVELTNGDKAAELRYASFLYASGEYEEAIIEMERLLQDTNSVILVRLLGYSYAEKGNAAEAKRNLDRYFKMMKGKEKFLLATDYEYMGKTYLLMEKDSLAALEYEKAVAMDPTKVSMFGELGESFFKAKKYEKAAEALSRVIDAGEGKFKDYFFWANSYYMTNDSLNAEMAFNKVAEKYPTTHISFLYLGRIKAKQDPDNKLWLAKPSYEKVWELLSSKEGISGREQNDLKEAAQYLGFHYYSQGQDCVNSKIYWEKVKEIDPENEGAKQVLDFCK